MNKFWTHARRAMLALVVLLGAFGLAIGGGGATGTGYMAKGLLSAFGSIFVNGIEFFTDSAAITINGVPNRSQSDLKLGMVLTVNGALRGNGTKGDAATVVYQADAIGALDAVNADGTLTVLGRTVSIDDRTIFAGFLNISELQVGNFVEVSGYPSPAGVLASRIEKLGSIPNVQVSGTIDSVADGTFTIGTLTVDATHAALKNVPATGFAAGQQVVAKGPAPSAGVLAATEVEVVQTSFSGNSNGSTSGVIAAVAPSSLTIEGQSYAITSGTQFVNGTAARLAAGVLVKVDYAVVSSTLVATKVEFTQLKEATQLTAPVTSVASSSLEVLGPDGVTISVDANTQLRDSSGKGTSIALSDFRAGDWVQVRGNQVAQSTVLATRIDRTRPSATVNIEGLVLSAAAPTFAVLDVVITVDASTSLRDETGTPVTPDVFFAKAAGHDATVVAVQQGGVLHATSVMLDY